MAQDTTPAIIVYQGDGSNSVFDVPFDKGYYGDIKVLFVRRGLADYTYNPNTFTVSGRLYAWQNGGAKIYTHTPNPAIGAPTYNSSDVEQAETVSAIAGQTITVDSLVYSRAVQHDISSNMKLTWTGDTLEVGDFICIVRDTERGQPYEMPNNQKHIERALDNIERQVQEVKDATDNALKIDPSHDIPDSHKMNPIDWLNSIIRCMDFSVRALRYANGWLDYSLDDPNIADEDKTWTHLLSTENIKNIREQSYIVDGVTYYRTQYMASDGTWKTLSDPSKWDNMKLTDLKDTNIVNPTAGHFLMFDGLKWKNTVSSGTVGWGAILGTITDQTDLMNKFSEYVKTDGSSTMTNPLMMRATEDFKCAIAPYWDGVGFFKLNDNNSVTLMASIEYNSGFEPATTNTYNIGASARKWKNLYLAGKAYISTINNGYDLAVPAKSGTLATKEEVDLAANSGRMILDQGVWYAKMYAATVAPSAEDGTNYADFSQTDNQGNPIIVTYNRINGAWVQDQTITPPAEYDGYVSVTSKIWDITEQAGQQGGRTLWNHQSKEFTPYPQIISFENAALTGVPTAPLPTDASPNNQIATKEYVDSHSSTGGYHPGLFAHEWDDHIRNDVQWLRADTFSWQSGDVYEAAYNELKQDQYISYGWFDGIDSYVYTSTSTPEVGDTVYSDKLLTTPYKTVTSVSGSTITISDYSYTWQYDYGRTNLQTETVAGITITYLLSKTGRKICLDTQESNVEAIYNATGVAWYYIIDLYNKRFKLPRSKHNKYTETLGVVGNGLVLGLTNGTNTAGTTFNSNTTSINPNRDSYGLAVSSSGTQTGNGLSGRIGVTTDPTKSGIIAQQTQDTDQYKYLYFYVGEFTQEAIENTAGLNAELFNGKADTDFNNTNMIDYVVSFQAPTAANNYTWYRKYKSGWVEQGGTAAIGASATTVNLIVEMADTNYQQYISLNQIGNYYVSANKTGTTTISVRTQNTSGTGQAASVNWEVKGMAAS